MRYDFAQNEKKPTGSPQCSNATQIVEAFSPSDDKEGIEQQIERFKRKLGKKILEVYKLESEA